MEFARGISRDKVRLPMLFHSFEASVLAPAMNRCDCENAALFTHLIGIFLPVWACATLQALGMFENIPWMEYVRARAFLTMDDVNVLQRTEEASLDITLGDQVRSMCFWH